MAEQRREEFTSFLATSGDGGDSRRHQWANLGGGGTIPATAARFLRRRLDSRRRQRDSCDGGAITGDDGAGGRLQRQRRRSIQYACEGRNRETERWAVGLGLLMGYERMASSRVLAVSLCQDPMVSDMRGSRRRGISGKSTIKPVNCRIKGKVNCMIKVGFISLLLKLDTKLAL